MAQSRVTPTPQMELPSIPANEVQLHRKTSDAWMIVHNKVYDVTDYMEDHPGGVEILLGEAGKDATQVFEDVGHSDEARELLQSLLIGEIPASVGFSIHSSTLWQKVLICLFKERVAEVEIYRPTFEVINQTTAIKTKSQPSNGLASFWWAVAKVCLIGASGEVARLIYHYRKQWPGFIQASLGGLRVSGTRIWISIGMVSTAQFLLTFGLLSWGVSKLDFKQDMLSFPAYRRRHPNTFFKPSAAPTSFTCQLHPQTWTNLTLREKARISMNVYRFVFNLPNTKQPLGLPSGQHVALRAKIGNKDVVRSYTPISDDREIGHVDLLIKVYPTGTMTKYLESLEEGDCVEFRGPKGAMRYTSDYSEKIVMIAGGTGITPMYQIIRAICLNPSDATQVNLLYANNSETDMLLREQIDSLASRFPQNLKAHYILVNPPSGWQGSVGFITEHLVKKSVVASSQSSRVMLCGPPPMLAAVKKILSALDFHDPKPVSQMEDEVFVF
ncbi:hypothetical protein DTO012A7_5902 [Penicillium roqueforti]|nr:hypothetical protein LCP963914a_6133 [Penicillium roqueforti]KAI3133092.1 hypothetical protein CBS147326_4895 [Penicillium roqueforti]KAI3229599.1 hypothetical protein DTO012A7_5902 [Penicillium roqueforti]KAI3250209.1 hypothetical protein CBS147309_8198 [Penicillium roqueforti]